jgi:hypothetical protein
MSTSRGSFKVEAPHICGQMIEVTVKWSSDSGGYWTPPDSDEEWEYPDKCECGVDLRHDSLFQSLVEKLVEHVYKHGDTGEVSPYDLSEPEEGWDDVYDNHHTPDEAS